jgi:hypothetical protein
MEQNSMEVNEKGKLIVTDEHGEEIGSVVELSPSEKSVEVADAYDTLVADGHEVVSLAERQILMERLDAIQVVKLEASGEALAALEKEEATIEEKIGLEPVEVEKH